MRKLLTVCSTLGLLLCAAGAQAQDRPFVPLPEGQTLLNVSATERTQVQQDTLIASMNVTKNGADPRTIQNEINTLMQHMAGGLEDTDFNPEGLRFTLFYYDDEDEGYGRFMDDYVNTLNTPAGTPAR